ncbi:hypothetical protein C8Q77DRAFT_1156328 [Trametes polyzona]|nr:hypothetical protein C8Q77DRAFT_1156328 [Trametes polyzona]
MSPKRKNGAANKQQPPAQPKPVATTAKAPAPPSQPPSKPAQAPPAPPAAPSTQRVSPQPSAGPSRPGVTIQTNPVAAPPRTLAQPPKPSAQPARSALASHLRNAPAQAHVPTSASAAKSGPPLKRVITRSDRVRAEWNEFEASWVKPRQNQIEKELDELFKAAERTSRAKGKTRSAGAPDGMDKIVTTMQRDFALAARAEWEARLERANLVAEDWADMTLEEMIAVEQVLAYEEVSEEPGVYAQVKRESIATTSSGSTAVADTTPPAPVRSMGGWTSRAPQKAHASQPLRNTQSVASRPIAVTEDQSTKATFPWGTKAASNDGSRVSSKQPAAPIPVTPSSSASSRSAQPSAHPAPAAVPIATSTELLVYAVPISLTQPPSDPALMANAEYANIVEKLYLQSITQFHQKAVAADVEFARQLRKPMPPADRDFAIRSHQMFMEQCARDVVTRRNKYMDEERKKLGLDEHGGPGGDSAPPSSKVPPPRPAQVSGAFPEERVQPTKRPEPEPEPLLEYIGAQEPEPEPEREPEADVDEVIEIPIKGKGKKKGKKPAVEPPKPATNGRSTPTLAASTSSAKAAAPAPKATPAAESKGKAPAAPTAAWNTARTAPARAASPAPINTKVGLAASAANGRGSPAPGASSSTPSPWEARQAKAGGVSTSAEDAKAAAAQNGIWAPPVARGGSNSKNPFAPARPSRLAQVTTPVSGRGSVPASPESPEPPSPPPSREPTGQDYVAWFAGSSSEDDESISEGLLDEDDDDDEEDEEGASGSSGFGASLLSSLAGASPWALFGEGSQPQRARAASPARGRGVTPTPARAAAAPPAKPAYTTWGMPTAGPSGSSHAGPSAGPSAPPGMWKQESEGEDLEQMLEIASSALNTAVAGAGRKGGVNIEEAMAMYVTASKARETLATPVGGRSGWRR